MIVNINLTRNLTLIYKYLQLLQEYCKNFKLLITKV